MSEQLYLSLLEQGPIFFILAIVVFGIGYSVRAVAKWGATSAEVWIGRHLNQMDQLIDENKKDRQVYLESMEKLNHRLDRHEETLSRIEKRVS